MSTASLASSPSMSEDMSTATVTRLDERSITTTGPLAVTLRGSNVLVPTTYLSTTVTAQPPSKALLEIASCTTPYFAVITAPGQAPIQFPQVGCSPDYQDCCPYGFAEKVLLKSCPAGYVGMSVEGYRACCPTNFVLFPSGFAGQTPCYSNLSVDYVPATTISDPERRLVTQTLFAYSFPLVPAREEPPLGIILGSVGATVFVLIMLTTSWVWHRRACRRRASATPADGRASAPRRRGSSAKPRPPPKDLKDRTFWLSFGDGASPDASVPRGRRQHPQPHPPARPVELPVAQHNIHPAFRDSEGGGDVDDKDDKLLSPSSIDSATTAGPARDLISPLSQEQLHQQIP